MSIITDFLSFFANLVPTTKIIVFNSFPDFSDNAYALCKCINEKGLCEEYRLVWLVSNKEKASIQKRIKDEGFRDDVVSKKSLKGVWTFVRARYVFSTHGLMRALHLKQHPDKTISLWHGMPLKLLGRSINDSESFSFDYTLASSSVYQDIMAEAFGVDKSKVLVVNQPRCDLLFEPTRFFVHEGIDKSKYSRIGIWMPTFRKAIYCEERLDGSYHEGFVSFFDEKMMHDLDKHLSLTNALLIIKLHPMDALQNQEFASFTNIIIIKPQFFKDQLYPLLGSCDYLLTDYSSVFIDYEICRKPIGFVMDDYDEYKSSRGFYFDDFDALLPGPILSNYDEFVQFIDNPYVVTSNIKLNDYYDNRSCERLLKALGLVNDNV